MSQIITIRGQDDRSIATILAALRYFQANYDDAMECNMEHFNDVEPLSIKQIDVLCMSICMDAVEL